MVQAETRPNVLGDGIYESLQRSIDDSRRPQEPKKFVRAFMFNYTRVEQLPQVAGEPESHQSVQLFCTDLKGKVPMGVIEKFMSKAMNNMVSSPDPACHLVQMLVLVDYSSFAVWCLLSGQEEAIIRPEGDRCQEFRWAQDLGQMMNRRRTREHRDRLGGWPPRYCEKLIRAAPMNTRAQVH